MKTSTRCMTGGKHAAALIVASTAMLASAGNPLPEPGFPQSCGVQLKTESFTVETLEKVHALGFRAVRRGFYWNSVEKVKGTYDFSDYDKQMDRARELGLTVVVCLFSGHKEYEDDGLGGIQTEAGRQGFANFAAATTAHYKGRSVIFEIWNEPNVRTFWRKDGMHNSEPFADEYTALVKAVMPAMLKADPDCCVVAGSVSNYWQPSYEWTEFCFKKGILGTGIRAWSVHPYGVKTPEEFAVGHARMRELLKQYGSPDLPLVDTERGFAVKESAEGWSGGSQDKVREYQAWHFVRQYMADQLAGVRLTVWYEWGGAEFGISDEKSPAYAACRTMLAQLDGYRLARRVESDSDRDYVLLFENTSGQRKLVAWTSPSPGGSPDEAKPHTATVDLVTMTAGTAVDGSASEVEISTGALRLLLSGAPQYVAVPEGARLGSCRSHALVASAAAAPAAGAAPAAVAEATAPAAAAPAEPPKPIVQPAGSVDLKLFDAGVAWNFVKNTGEGSFVLGTDAEGKPIGTMTYDFTASKSKGTPYVLASAPVAVAEGATEILLHARTAIAQPLTFRIVDSTDQTHQTKARAKGTGQWEPIRIPLNRKLEHWGGANDGKVHFPVKSIVFSVPLPGEASKTGKVEYAGATAN